MFDSKASVIECLDEVSKELEKKLEWGLAKKIESIKAIIQDEYEETTNEIK